MLVPYEHNIIEQAVEATIRNSSKFPTLAEFLQTLSSVPRKHTENKSFCNICNNNGFIITTRSISTNEFASTLYGEQTELQVLCHCICEKGKDYEYHSCSVLEYYGTDEIDRMAAKNVFNRGKRNPEAATTHNKRIQEYLRKAAV